MTKAICIAFLLFFSLAAPVSAFAQGENKAAAQALYEQGVDLWKAKDYPAAADKLDASQKLDPAIGTLLYLGDCYEKMNKKASAWAAFKEASSLAQAQRDDRQKTADVRAAALMPQISKLVVRVDEATRALPGFVVRRDGVELPAASLGSPLPINAGSLAITASATGYQSWNTTVTIPDGGKTITVVVPKLEASASATPTPLPPPPGPPPPDPIGDDAADDGSSTPLLVAGIVVTVGGLAGVAVGSVFGLMARSSRDDSLVGCRSETLCPAEQVALREDAQSEATISTITFIIGGVLVAGGVTLVIISQTTSSDAPAAENGGRATKTRTALVHRLELAPAIGFDHVSQDSHLGLSLRGAW